MDELKPCPFCGSNEIRIIDSITNFNIPVTYVICCNCQSRGASKREKQKAINMWNTRKRSRYDRTREID